MTTADRVLLVALGVLIGWLFQSFWSAPVTADFARVSGPQGTQHVVLNQDTQLGVEGPLGTSHIEVKDGRIRFAASPCRHQICVRSGWHSRAGAIAACVPNRISVSLQGSDPEYDGLSF